MFQVHGRSSWFKKHLEKEISRLLTKTQMENSSWLVFLNALDQVNMNLRDLFNKLNTLLHEY